MRQVSPPPPGSHPRPLPGSVSPRPPDNTSPVPGTSTPGVTLAPGGKTLLTGGRDLVTDEGHGGDALGFVIIEYRGRSLQHPHVLGVQVS